MTALIVLSFALAAPPPAEGLRVPPGFEVVEYAGNDLATDITCMTLDPKGRIVVAGRGYLRILVDDDGDGVADRSLDFTKDVRDAAHGLLWERDTLYAVVDGGLRRFTVAASGDKSAGPSELIRRFKTGGEHDAHALRRGPDGWLYLLCGNSAGIDRSFATLATSPIRAPVAGCVVRFTPDLKESEIVADGFRNPYGFDFDLRGELFTYDSDNERCVSLPWYEGTRVYRVVPGGHHGWRNPQLSDTWRCPPYFADVAQPLADLGRGSPTGVVCYRHSQFPSEYRGGLFCLDWTFGRIWYVPTSAGTMPRLFLEATGANGFAPTAAVVQPQTGHLFVAIGGRGTRGAVYRIRWAGASDPNQVPSERVPRLAYPLDWNTSTTADLQRLGPLPALAYVKRLRERFSPAAVRELIRQTWESTDREVTQAASALIADLPSEQRSALALEARSARAWLTTGYAAVAHDPDLARKQGERVLAWTGKQGVPSQLAPTTSERLDAIRLIQLALGDLTAREAKGSVWAGYTCRQPLPADRYSDLRTLLRKSYPSNDMYLDREMTRTLAVLEDDDPKTLHRVLAAITRDSDPLDDIHHLIVASRLRGPRSRPQTQAVAAALLDLDRKITDRKRTRDRNWPLRIAELHAELAHKDPHLNDALIHRSEFGRGDHVLFTRCPDFDRKQAAEIFLNKAQRDSEFPWTAELVALLGELPVDRRLELLRSLWQRGGLEESILPLLAESPHRQDLACYLTGLTSPRLATVRASLGALAALAPPYDGTTVLELIRCWRLLPDGREGDALRRQTVALLRRVTGRDLGSDPQAWSAWLAKKEPALAGRLAGPDGVDLAAWDRRQREINWLNGDVERGRKVFARASCAACHSGSQALGPDLSGVTSRFSRNDLFIAIVTPSRDISPRYRTTQIDTSDGKTYQGLVVYEAVDSLILQTGAAETVRIDVSKIETRRVTSTSLMPAGLLDKLSDAEVADVYRFLQDLGKK